jgi:tRNA(Arg) A34 adenosine deaminase TadA
MLGAVGAAIGAGWAQPAAAATRADFVEAAFDMRYEAITNGELPYGAVVVQGGAIVGRGAARIRERGYSGHAERVAMRAAQERLGREDLSDCVLYATSNPCDSCRRAAAQARIVRVYFGLDGTDGGKP